MTTESAPLPPSPVATVIEAVQTRRCVNAIYNRDKVVLAPHVLYMRHGEPFVDAVTVARNGMLPREIKVGTFKLSGLGDLVLTGRSFEVHRAFDGAADKYAGAALITVEREAALA
jgi:hypothetical protein